MLNSTILLILYMMDHKPILDYHYALRVGGSAFVNFIGAITHFVEFFLRFFSP